MASAITVSNETKSSMTRVTKEGRQLTYEMEVIQQPERARACGSGAKCTFHPIHDLWGLLANLEQRLQIAVLSTLRQSSSFEFSKASPNKTSPSTTMPTSSSLLPLSRHGRSRMAEFLPGQRRRRFPS